MLTISGGAAEIQIALMLVNAELQVGTPHARSGATTCP